MIKPIVRDIFLLQRKAVPATKKDLQVAVDLTDTLRFYRESCVGLAANMIGYNVAMIIVAADKKDIVMINPQILEKSGPYEAEEGCLSLDGKRSIRRYQKIKVTYTDIGFHKRTEIYEGYTAEIIQHECDHLNGILI